MLHVLCIYLMEIDLKEATSQDSSVPDENSCSFVLTRRSWERLHGHDQMLLLEMVLFSLSASTAPARQHGGSVEDAHE